ncbi:hypothetical protein K6119_13310 [Paracrocinitomix mangrovi]|uniref:hypothetical protein n=1 Tax=Paracrocinitomix mangrovi TaxID=2862509 RepID=UPI001C8E45CF|nr:hypothetical protein [Paracrocinitomix mangrovi]UKN00709.1 hypothetical protein K6119_13310 [Paracrocinitomix mangrovi]
MKKLIAFFALFIAFTGFSQANTLTAKVVGPHAGSKITLIKAYCIERNRSGVRPMTKNAQGDFKVSLRTGACACEFKVLYNGEIIKFQETFNISSDTTIIFGIPVENNPDPTGK